MSNIIDLQKKWNNAISFPKKWKGDLFFYNDTNKRIRYGHAPAQGKKKGTIVLTHGYGEHIDLYMDVISRYQKKGYEVFAMDWEGFGLSKTKEENEELSKPPAKSMWSHADDLHRFVTDIVKKHHDPALPLIAHTHSMGGHINLLYTNKHPDVFDGVVTGPPMYDIFRLGMGHWARPLIRGIFNIASAGINCAMSKVGKVLSWLTGKDHDWKDVHLNLADVPVPALPRILDKIYNIGNQLSRSFHSKTSFREKFQEFTRDVMPHAQTGRPTIDWLVSSYRTIDESMTKEFLKAIKTPTLIFSAGKDDLVANDAHRWAAKNMQNARNVLIPNSEHGIWYTGDKSYEKIWSNIDSFLDDIENKDKKPGRTQTLPAGILRMPETGWPQAA